MLVVCSLFMYIPQMLYQVLPEKKLLLADAAGHIKVSLGSMLLPHMAVKLTPVGEADGGFMQVAHNASVPDLSPWTVMRFKTLLLTEKLHTNRAVRDLFIGVPGAEVCEEVVFLVEVKRTDKTLESSPLLVECLYVGQQEVSVGELFLALRALAGLYLVTVL